MTLSLSHTPFFCSPQSYYNEVPAVHIIIRCLFNKKVLLLARYYYIEVVQVLFCCF